MIKVTYTRKSIFGLWFHRVKVGHGGEIWQQSAIPAAGVEAEGSYLEPQAASKMLTENDMTLNFQSHPK